MKRSWLVLKQNKKNDSSSVRNESMLSNSLLLGDQTWKPVEVVHPADLKVRISLFEQWFIFTKNVLKVPKKRNTPVLLNFFPLF